MKKTFEQELLDYTAHLSTMLEIVELSYSKQYFGGKFSEWLREHRASLVMMRGMLYQVTYVAKLPIAKTEPFRLFYDVVAKISWSQGQQKSLPVVRRMAHEAFDSMYAAGWARSGSEGVR